MKLTITIGQLVNMTQEDKEFLLKELCAILLYGAVCRTEKGEGRERLFQELRVISISMNTKTERYERSMVDKRQS